jgi:hypothetical protein
MWKASLIVKDTKQQFRYIVALRILSFFFTSRKLIFSLCNQMENNQYHTVRTFLEFNSKPIERGKIYTPKHTTTHFAGLIQPQKSGWIKLVPPPSPH